MNVAIVLVGLVLYLGLAVAVGRFCGVNAAWERAVQQSMRDGAIPDEQGREGLVHEVAEEPTAAEVPAAEPKENTATQFV